jgi:pimeloyl-ACP methyl ester carboxylesterase
MSKIARIDPPRADSAKPVVIALHCSGGSGRQWRHLAEALGGRFDVIAPDLFGCGARGHWSGEGPFRLTDEAALIVDIIDNCEGPVHLVGHSYGGGVALRAAVERSTRIASLSLYEPTAFHMLKATGPDGQHHLAEIRGVAGDVQRAVVSGNYHAAARRFVDYWNGEGAWSALRPEHQAELVRYVPKACLDFGALIEEPMPLVAYRRIHGQLLLLQGEHAPAPTRAIVRKMTSFMKPAGVISVAGAGHMGPFSHAQIVAEAIAQHIAAIEPRAVARQEAPIRAAA